MLGRHGFFLLLCALPVIALWEPACGILALSFRDDRYAHVVLVPVISATLIVFREKQIFHAVHSSPHIRPIFLCIGPAFWYAVRACLPFLNPTDRLTLVAFGIVVSWLGGFRLCYGAAAFRIAVFPLLFLFLFVPLPTAVLERAVLALQQSSAAVSEILFRVLGVPVLRRGFRFSLPGVDILIAEQCSGIRSSLSLLIASLVAGYVLLQETWKKTCLALAIFPIVVFKNALRIVTMSWFGIYVDSRFFYGSLHRYGGLLFSLLSLAILAVLISILRGQRGSPPVDREPLMRAAKAG